MRLARALLASAALVASSGGMLWLDLVWSEREGRPADVRAAYKIGILTALNGSDLDDVDAGRPARPIFGPAGQRGSSVFVWQKAVLERPGDCLGDRAGHVPDAICRDQDTVTSNDLRLVFAPSATGGRSIGVHAEALEATQKETTGAVFGARGEIGLGRGSDQASRFLLDIEGPFVRDGSRPPQAAQDEEFEEGEGRCRPALDARPTSPMLLAPWAVRLRLCTFEAKDGRRLVILQHQHARLHLVRRLAVARCRGLILAVIPARDLPDYAGCFTANWNESAPPEAGLVLFQSHGRGTWSLIGPDFPTRDPLGR